MENNNETKNNAFGAFEIFSNKNLGSVRVVLNATKKVPEYWFVAKDVCDCLGIKNISDACADLLNDEKTNIVLNDNGSNNYKHRLMLVSESGLYMLIMRSRKPEAKEFQRWVTRDVLPTLRRTGTYNMKESTYKEDSKYWFEMYCNILDDYVKDVGKRRSEEPKVIVPNNKFVEGVWTNKDMFVIGDDGKYSIIEREMRQLKEERLVCYAQVSFFMILNLYLLQMLKEGVNYEINR